MYVEYFLQFLRSAATTLLSDCGNHDQNVDNHEMTVIKLKEKSLFCNISKYFE